MTEDEAKQARPHAELIAELLDPRIAKNEREHAASREIERLMESLTFIRDKELAALGEVERLRFKIPNDARCMEILHVAQAALKGKP